MKGSQFSLDQINNRDPEVEPKTLDAWSWSQGRSLNFEFRLHSPRPRTFHMACYN